MSGKEIVFKVENLHKTFHIGFFRKRVEAVRGVDLEVGESEIFGLLGPNGAGKTTLIKTAMGLIRPTRGKIHIFGKNSRDKAAHKDLGYLPENPYFHEYLTPGELLELHGRLCSLSRAEIFKRRDSLIEKVGLKDAKKLPLRKFSKGMLQRIGLAQALIGNPKLLVLDQPMSGLDPIGRKFVADLIKTLNEKGTTIIFSSHILPDVEGLCHRVAILDKGKKIEEGSVSELIKEEMGEGTLEDLFIRKAAKQSEDRVT